ncbi:MAG: prepilin-type N-terminal cleavage/methylation domain-containing protein [Thermoanaerobaculia bacterium]
MKRNTRGSSFVEVLLAMTIMALVLVGILQMFSVSLVINKGSAARTQMLFKCQQVVENVRLFYFLAKTGAPTPGLITEAGHAANSPMSTPGALPDSFSATTCPVTQTFLPYASTDATWAYWGPAGANVMEQDNGPYKISYTIIPDNVQKMWVITVSATPTDVAGATRYFGIGTSSGKRVDYVAQFNF